MNIRTDGGIATSIKQLFLGKPQAKEETANDLINKHVQNILNMDRLNKAGTLKDKEYDEKIEKELRHIGEIFEKDLNYDLRENKVFAILLAKIMEINPMSGMPYMDNFIKELEAQELEPKDFIRKLIELKNIKAPEADEQKIDEAKANAGRAQINLQEETTGLWNDLERIAEDIKAETHSCEAIDTDDFMKTVMNYEPGSYEWKVAIKNASTEQLKIARGRVYTKWANVYRTENLNPRFASILHRKHKELDFEITQRVKNKGKIEDEESIEFNKLTEAMEKAEAANENERRKASVHIGSNPQAAQRKALPTGTSAPPVTSSGRGETPVPPPFDDAYKNRNTQKGEVGELW